VYVIKQVARDADIEACVHSRQWWWWWWPWTFKVTDAQYRYN